MYFPYLRGKQFELLALRELSELLGDQQSVRPVIEPVRGQLSGAMGRCLESLVKDNVRFTLIANPSVGELRSDTISSPISEFINNQESPKVTDIGLLIQEHTDVRELLTQYRDHFDNRFHLSLIHREKSNQLERLAEMTQGLPVGVNIVEDQVRPGHFAASLHDAPIINLRDVFKGEKRNSDFLERPESLFSEEHLFFQQEGWAGFSDYLTIGAPFNEGGFRPRAVVIHWTYEPTPGSPVMIRNFTSESNDDTSDVAGKFLEAAKKLSIFVDEQSIETIASNVIRRHVQESTYPGLGILKKLSIQNHLELMSRILSRK